MPRKQKNKTNGKMSVFFILDGSGSMSGVQDDVVGGVNTFIEEQQKENPDGVFSLTVFDTNIKKHVVAKPIKKVSKVDRKVTLMGGMTALLDAVGKTVSEVENDKLE